MYNQFFCFLFRLIEYTVSIVYRNKLVKIKFVIAKRCFLDAMKSRYKCWSCEFRSTLYRKGGSLRDVDLSRAYETRRNVIDMHITAPAPKHSGKTGHAFVVVRNIRFEHGQWEFGFHEV